MDKQLGAAARRKEPGAALLCRLLGTLTLAEDAVWERHGDVVSEALHADVALQRWAADLFPEGTHATQAWRELLLTGGVIHHVAARGAEAVADWVARLLDWLKPAHKDVEGWLARAMAVLGPVAATSKLPVPLNSDQDAAVVDVLAEHGVPMTWPDDLVFNLRAWSRRQPRRPLEHLAAHPGLRSRLAPSYDRSNHLGRDEVLREAAMQSPALSGLFDDKVAAIAANLRGAPLARLDLDQEHLKAFITADSLAALPALAEVVRSIDVANMLARTLRQGIMDELCWPTQDTVNDGLGSDVAQYATDGPFPYWLMNHGESGTIVALGPEGEVYRKTLPEGVPGSARSMRYVDGDVLYFTLESSLRVARWLSDPSSMFQTTLYSTWTRGVRTPGGGCWEGAHTLHAGDQKLGDWTFENIFSDGKRFWAGRKEVDPDTQKALRNGLPPWLAEFEVDGAELCLPACTYWPVPRQLEGSLLGVRDGQAGTRVRKHADGTWELETIDGRRWSGALPGLQPCALLRLPERDHDVLYVTSGHSSDIGLWSADGKHPVLPPTHGAFYAYWNGSPQWLPLMWWHYLEPRDRAGSKALARCTREQAQALLDAAVRGEEPRTEVLTSGGKVTAFVTRAHTKERSALDALPALAAAIETNFPEIGHRRLASGVARIVERARGLVELVEQWRQAAAPTARPASTTGLVDADVSILSAVYGHGWGYGESKFEASLRAAAHFLEQPNDPCATPRAMVLTGSHLPWEALLLRGGALVRTLLSPAVTDETRRQVRAALEVWADTDFAAHPERYRVLGLECPQAWPGISHETGEVGVQAATRYALRTTRWEPGRYGYNAIERADRETCDFPGRDADEIDERFPGRNADEIACGSRAAALTARPQQMNKNFTDPDWATLRWTAYGRDAWATGERIRAALATFEAHGPLPWHAEIGQRVAAATGLLPATAALLWMGAVGHFVADASLRQTLGLTKAEVELAAKELPGDLTAFFARALPADPAALYSPLVDDGSGRAPVDRFADVWVELYGKRRPLDVALVRQLEADFHTRQESFHLDVRVFEEPEKYRFLTEDTQWVLRPWRGFMSNVSYMRGSLPPGWPKHASQSTQDEGGPDVNAAFSGWVLRQFLRYVPWAHQELPVGHPARDGLACMCELIAKRLENPELMLLAGAVDLSNETDPHKLSADYESLVHPFVGEPYVAVDGGESAGGIDRGDLVVTWPKDLKNALFFAVRPARARAAAEFAKMAQDLGFYDVFMRTGGGCTCGLNFGSYEVVDLTELPAWLVWQSDGFQRMAARLGNSGLAPGAFESDPRAAAPETWEAARASLRLSEAATTLYLQTLTLAEPTRPRVMRVNGWRKPQLDAAQGELLGRGLLVEARYDGTPRDVFVPGPMAFPASPAPTMEASKLALYGLEPDPKGRLRAPFGAVVPLRPLPELFAEAWRAVETAR